ncbi:MAG: hypothetical protein LBK25_08810 [Treponema sp.]|jgi:hypothetical protein|nr:hypothetical protein [Treponema sp.]
MPNSQTSIPGPDAKYYGWLNYLLAYDYNALAQSKLMTKSPFVLTLPQEAEKNIFSCAARWQSERGELGPFSEVKTADVWR